jgi:hypothetical protein|tara:strand:+ start:74900 stop:76666 length:1767 start_codon:yes stop_codon:yes gene_type:complete
VKKNIPARTHLKRIAELQKKRGEILSLMPEKALKEILEAHQPAALVHSFPEEDFYFLVNDIGPGDAIELLSLASNRQWEYILDLEVWEKDRIEIKAVTKWFDLLLRSDSNRFLKWILDEKVEFFEFYLFHSIEVKIREHDQDPSVFGEDFTTLDDIFYIRFIDHPFKIESNDRYSEHRKELLSTLIRRLADYDHVTYQKVLLEASSIIPAESEEETYRLRNVRLAEKGFLPSDEAIGVYQPMAPSKFNRQGVKSILSNSHQLHLPVPLYHTGMLEEDNLFTLALKRIEKDEVLQQIQTEFAALCNRIIAADLKTIRERGELKKIVQKACGYLSIGLEGLTDKDRTPDTGQAAAFITKFPLYQIFRVGFGFALELKWQAEKWRKKSWYEKVGLSVSFWGEEWLGVLDGLLIKRPLFYDNYKSGLLYREFVSMEDIKWARGVLDQIIYFDNLLSLMEIKLDSVFSYSLLSHKNLVLTLWAKDHLKIDRTSNRSELFRPMSFSEVKSFFENLWLNEKKPRKIKISMKKAFLDWLSDKTGLIDYEITDRLGRTFENIFDEIENEYGEVSEKEMDPRYIHLFLIEGREISRRL